RPGAESPGRPSRCPVGSLDDLVMAALRAHPPPDVWPVVHAPTPMRAVNGTPLRQHKLLQGGVTTGGPGQADGPGPSGAGPRSSTAQGPVRPRQASVALPRPV